MGKEFSCTVRIDGVAAPGKLHLDSHALRIAGSRRLTVALSDVTRAAVLDDTLRLKAKGMLIELDLGASRAQTWRAAIVSPKTLLEKLGVRPAERVYVKDLSEDGFVRDLAHTVTTPPSGVLRGTFDVAFLGIADPSALNAVGRVIAHLIPAGALWIVYPKGKASPVPDAAVRAAAREHGLYDAKVVAFSATHTATKWMFPLAARAALLTRSARPSRSSAR
jgi:hypothetical protein